MRRRVMWQTRRGRQEVSLREIQWILFLPTWSSSSSSSYSVCNFVHSCFSCLWLTKKSQPERATKLSYLSFNEETDEWGKLESNLSQTETAVAAKKQILREKQPASDHRISIWNLSEAVALIFHPISITLTLLNVFRDAVMMFTSVDNLSIESGKDSILLETLIFHPCVQVLKTVTSILVFPRVCWHLVVLTAHPHYFNQLSCGLDIVSLAGEWLTAAANTNM